MTGGRGSAAALALLALAAGGCRKAPLVNIGAHFDLADTSWFAQEDTLFVFYQVTAEQGLNERSTVEITWTTDAGVMPWTPLSALANVHTHLPVDCGVDSRCGSASIAVPLEPRDVHLRFRYDRDGLLALAADTVYNVVGHGPAWSHRSLIVYGVFDEANQRIEWRSRNQFPTLRNEQAEAYGLRRRFTVADAAFGNAELATDEDPYGYAAVCPADFVPTGFGVLTTEDRAAFYPEPLPNGASTASTVCAQVTVTDANGEFTRGAIAQKNPEVRPAFPVLRSPIRDAVQVPFFLGPCERTISEEHEAMLRQRLQLEGVPTTCTEGWDQPEFVGTLAATFRDAVEAARPAGQDMVLKLAIEQDDPAVSEAVEQALALVVPQERDRTSPRLAGAFVLDSDIRGITVPELADVTLWCPSTLDGDITDASTRSCAIAPDNLNIELGPFTFGTLPILPSRDQYLDFISTYSVRQAGEVTGLSFRAPEFATTTIHAPLGDFGVATFLNNEVITTVPGSAFSYCAPAGIDFAVFQSDLIRSAEVDCYDLGITEYSTYGAYCDGAPLPLSLLPDWHSQFDERTYYLGLAWDFPFLLAMDYQTFTAGSVSAFGFSVPFGFGDSAHSYYGSVVWSQNEYPVGDELTQCDRFCDHPTFDSAGVYHVTEPFAETYAHACYVPDYPQPGDSGFPLDP